MQDMLCRTERAPYQYVIKGVGQLVFSGITFSYWVDTSKVDRNNPRAISEIMIMDQILSKSYPDI